MLESVSSASHKGTIMKCNLIIPGQVYFHQELNDYIVVTKSARNEIFYKCVGLHGHLEARVFLNTHRPVKVDVLTVHEKNKLSTALHEYIVLTDGYFEDEKSCA